MSRRQRSKLVFWGALAALVLPAACGSSGVVGGNCRANYLDCEHHCVDAQSDSNNCGACGHSCDSGVSCVDSVCGGPDASAGSAGQGAAGSPNAGASNGNAGTGNGGNGNGGSSGANSEGGTGASCGLAPYNQPETCGDCETQCTRDTPICSPDGHGSFFCVQKCDAPFVLCGSQCVDLNIDANHCGSCGTVCPSGICQGTKCVGANVGHVVVACMDYQSPAAGTPQTVLMGNAVFLPIRNPVRILAYTELVSTSAQTRVNQDIGYAAAARGRSYLITNSPTYADVTAKLNVNDYDVFMIYDQSAAATGQLAMVGAAWRTSTVLSSFSAAGGVIVALTGGTENDEMDQLLTASNLLEVNKLLTAAGKTLYNRAPGDALGVNVISPFLSPQSSCTIDTDVTPDNDTIFVVRDAAAPDDGAPVVVHRVIEP